jgi:hypothetical protein
MITKDQTEKSGGTAKPGDGLVGPAPVATPEPGRPGNNLYRATTP